MKTAFAVASELLSNLSRINRLAIFNLKTEFSRNGLGLLWVWINPAFQIAVYAFVFGSGLRNNRPVHGIPFFFWMTAGFIAWMFMSGAINASTKCVAKQINIVTKFNFPLSITPIITLVSEFYTHILVLVTVIVLFALKGVLSISLTSLFLLAYYTLAAMLFLTGLSLVVSSLAVMQRDMTFVVSNGLRLMFFLSPIFWDVSSMAPIFKTITNLNPFAYIIEGYRSALLGFHLQYFDYSNAIYFWAITVFLFVLGSYLNVHIRKNLLDYK